MIKLTDIKLAINAVLKDNFPDCKRYADEIKEGFDRPCFFVQIFPVMFNYDTVNFSSNKLMIVLNYFSRDGTDLENLKMYDELKKAFGTTITAQGRHLALQDIRTDTADGVLQFKFDLDFFDGITKDEEIHELMRELELIQRSD